MRNLFFLFVFVAFLLLNMKHVAHANFRQLGELSLMGSYSKTDYGGGAYATTKRYMIAGGVNITPITELELAFTDTYSHFNYEPYQTTNINEKILSGSVLQNLVPSTWVFQFYLKAGAAQYNRRQSGTINGIPTKEIYTKSPSGLMGIGTRLYLLRNFSLKVEAVTYLPDLRYKEIKDNFAIQGGLGWSF